MNNPDSLNLDELVLDRIDAAIPPLSSTQQAVLDAFCGHVESAIPYGIGDPSLMCEMPDVIEKGIFQEIDTDAVIAALHKIEDYGLLRIDTQMSDLDAMLTAKGWVSWSDWDAEAHLPQIAEGPAGSAWDWDSLLPTVPDPLRTQVIFKLRGFRTEHPNGKAD
jgi:hypothetical protein